VYVESTALPFVPILFDLTFCFLASEVKISLIGECTVHVCLKKKVERAIVKDDVK